MGTFMHKVFIFQFLGLCHLKDTQKWNLWSELRLLGNIVTVFSKCMDFPFVISLLSFQYPNFNFSKYSPWNLWACHSFWILFIAPVNSHVQNHLWLQTKKQKTEDFSTDNQYPQTSLALHYCPVAGHFEECSCHQRLLSNTHIQSLWTMWFWMFLPVVGTSQSLASSKLVNSWSSMKCPTFGKGNFRFQPSLWKFFPIKFSNVRIPLKKYTLKEMKLELHRVFKKEGWCRCMQGDREIYSPESCSGLRKWKTIHRKEKDEHRLDQEKEDGGPRNTGWGRKVENQRLNWKWKGNFFHSFQQMDEWRKF